MTGMRIRGLAEAAVVVTVALIVAACSDGSADSADDSTPDLELGEPVEVEVGGTTMEFAVDDVREGSVDDLTDQGVSVAGIEDRGVYFVTYSVSLTSGDIADADASELPVPGAEEWQLEGSGNYEPLRVIGVFDCTPERNQTSGVAQDAPLVACQAFVSRTDALPTEVTVEGLGSWSTQ